MRIIVWGINYAPEFAGIAPHNVALCEFLDAEGHEVEMVTSFAYYPTWQKSAEDRGRFYRTDVVNRIPVHRCWHFVPARVSALKRILHEGTFVFTSTLRALFLSAPDVYVIVSPPLLLGTAAWLVGKFKRAPFVFHVQDMQPDAAVGLGMLKANWFTKALYGLEAFAYRKASRVSGITAGMLESFKGKGVPEDKNNKYPTFETYREQIDGKYWFPTYTYADDELVFGNGNVVRIRELVKYSDFVVGHGKVTITEVGDPPPETIKPETPPTESKPAPAQPTQPTQPQISSQPEAAPAEGGMLNSKAIQLPAPNYPAGAKSVHAAGEVQVKVLVDETGKVISAEAIFGPESLRQAAVDAARLARFKPTLVNGVAVKVSGILTYNFKAQ